jgi:hypothetical protein
MTRQILIAVVLGLLGVVITLAGLADGIRLWNPVLILGLLLLADAVLRVMMLTSGDEQETSR